MGTTRGKRATRWAGLIALGALALLGSGCAWVGLTWGAFSYPTTQAGEPANVVARGEWAYVTRAEAGIEVLHLRRQASSRVLPLPTGLDSADDLAIADGLLFVLDARPPGYVAALSLADPATPALLGRPIAVDVGPFSGVAAGGGRLIVSGGTSLLSLRQYDAAGRLGAETATADLGRGQPDVLLGSRGELGLVSTHDWGPYFDLTVIRATLQPPQIVRLGSLPLDTYGFTPGGARPANFPLEAAAAAGGSIVHVAFAKGLAVVDISDAAAPKLLAQLELGVEPVNVDVRDGVAALVGSEPKPMLVLVDVRAPARPKILQSFPLPEGSLATGVALTASHAVVAAHRQGTLLFDRSKGVWEHIIQQPLNISITKESMS
jgi:hypothetical protein